MRTLKIIVNAILLFVALPVAIVGILGFALSPFQTSARATEPNDSLEVNDLMLSEVVWEQVRQEEGRQRGEGQADWGPTDWEQADESQADWGKADANREDGDLPVGNLEDDDLPAGGQAEVGQLARDQADWEMGLSSEGTANFNGISDSAQIEAEGASHYGNEVLAGAFVPAARTESAPAEGTESIDDSYLQNGFEVELGAVPSSVGEAYAESESSANILPDERGRYSSEQLLNQGVINDGGLTYTWYSQRVLPGGGLEIEGRHVSSEGYVVDGQERVVVASSDYPSGTELSVPFGSGVAVVLDTGCPSGVVDVYTDF